MNQEELEVVRQTFHIVDLIARSIHRKCGELIKLVEDDFSRIPYFARERLTKGLTKIQNSTEELEKEKRNKLRPILGEEPHESDD